MFDDWGWAGLAIVVAIIIGAIIFVPWLIGHALWWIVYALGFVKNDIGFWTKWLIGLAVGIVGGCFFKNSRSSE